jgi:hypothetical protein
MYNIRRNSLVSHAFLNSYANLVEDHFTKTVLQSLPEEQRSLDDEIPFMPPMSAYHITLLLPPLHSLPVSLKT